MISDTVLVALIGIAGSILTALIGATVTLATSDKIKGCKSASVIFGLFAGIGLIISLLIAAILIRPTPVPTNSTSSIPTLTTSDSSSIPSPTRSTVVTSPPTTVSNLPDNQSIQEVDANAPFGTGPFRCDRVSVVAGAPVMPTPEFITYREIGRVYVEEPLQILEYHRDRSTIGGWYKVRSLETMVEGWIVGSFLQCT